MKKNQINYRCDDTIFHILSEIECQTGNSKPKIIDNILYKYLCDENFIQAYIETENTPSITIKTAQPVQNTETLLLKLLEEVQQFRIDHIYDIDAEEFLKFEEEVLTQIEKAISLIRKNNKAKKKNDKK